MVYGKIKKIHHIHVSPNLTILTWDVKGSTLKGHVILMLSGKKSILSESRRTVQ